MKKNAATDLLDALRASVVPTEVPPGFYTVVQLAQHLGIDRRTMAGRLAKMTLEKKLFKIQQGQVCRPVPHYRLV